MAVTIRLARHGSKKRPYYRIVVADKRAPRDGRNLTQVGTYDPLSDPVEVTLDEEKISSWLKKGAKPSPTVASLLKKARLQN
ncbi:MAG: 30S ribosomal protein S16 [Deltaproteobacteria bacterium]